MSRDASRIFNNYRLIVEGTLSKVADNTEETANATLSIDDIKRLNFLKDRLADESEYYAVLLKKLRVMFVSSPQIVPTMAVDAYGNIFINVGFFRRLSDTQAVAILAHEVNHVHYKHVATAVKLGYNLELWNYCTDFCINRDLVMDGYDIPDGFYTPEVNAKGRYLIDLTKFFNLKHDRVVIDATDLSPYALYKIILTECEKHNKHVKKLIEELNKKGSPMDRHLSKEESDNIEPDKLTDQPKQPQKPGNTEVYKIGDVVQDQSGRTGKVVKATNPDGSGNQMLDIDWGTAITETMVYLKPILEAVEFNVPSSRVTRNRQGNEPGDKPGKGQGKGIDKSKPPQRPQLPDIKKDIPSEDKQIVDDYNNTVKNTEEYDDIENDQIKKASNQLDKQYKGVQKKANSSGSITSGGGSRGTFKATDKRSVNWESELANILKTSEETKSTLMPDWRSVSLGRYMRGSAKVVNEFTVTAMVDTSGSITESIFNQIMTEITHILSTSDMEAKLNLILWHSTAYYYRVGLTRADVDEISKIGFEMGGTNLGSALTLYYNKLDEFEGTDAIIVITDGELNGPNDQNLTWPDNVTLITVLFGSEFDQIVKRYPNNHIIYTGITG